MPFTFSHPAAVLPLNYLPKHWLSLTGLVVGSIIPDFEYFIRMRVLSIYSHTWPGLFWFDIPLGLVIFILYNNLIKDELIDHLPPFLNRRFSSFKNSIKTYKHPTIIIIISIAIGAASHILWDSFTHPTGYFVLDFHQLKRSFVILHHPIILYNILQQLSTIMGGLVVIVAIMNLPKGERTIKHQFLIYWLIIVFICAIVLIIKLYSGLNITDFGGIIITTISGILIGLIVSSVVSLQNSKSESNPSL